MFYVALFLLSPIVIWQALLVRKNVVRLPEADGLRAGVIGAGERLRVLYIGDSAAAGVGVAHLEDSLVGKLNARLSCHFSVKWQLHAKTGDSTKETISRLMQIAPEPCDIAIISLGVNEVTRATPIGVWWNNTARLIALLRTQFNCQHVVYTCVPPIASFPALAPPLRWLLGWRASQLNIRLRKGLENLPYVCLVEPSNDNISNKFADDGFHPNVSGYESWAEQVSKVVFSLCLKS